MTTRAGDASATGQAPAAAGPAGREAPGIPVLRSFALVWLVTLVVLLVTHPGRMVYETNLFVDIDPSGFLASQWHLWNPLNTFGTLNDQAIGYVVPMAPFYLAGQLAHVPVWVTERLWLSLIFTVGFTGVVRLAGALGIGSSASRFLAGLVFALWPAFTIVIGSASASVLPGMLAPWAVLPLVAATRDRDLNWRGAVGSAARSGIVVLCMGGVNAVVTIEALLLPGLFIVTHARGRCLFWLAGCWAAAVVVATSWWSLPLLLQGKYGFNFLPYIEQASTTTATSSANAALRGAGYWVAYLDIGRPSLSAGWAVVTLQIVIVGSAIAAAGGLYGLAMRSMPESVWLRLSVGIAAAGALAAYGGPLGGPFHRTIQDMLNGTLAPFRNVYKFEPAIAAALALGLAHATAAWLSKDTSHDLIREGVVVSVRFLAAVTLIGLAVPYLTGQILTPGSFQAVPGYWSKVAMFLADQSPRNPALVVPADESADYLWGYTHDEPLDALARSPVAERGQVPYGAGSQVLLSTAEDAIESGEQVNGLAAYLARAGIRYVVVRNDLNPRMTSYVSPVIVHQTLALSGFVRVAAFGPLITGEQTAPQATAAAQAALPSYPAAEVYVATGPADETVAGQPLSPVAVLPASQTVLVNGGPDALLQLAGQKLLDAAQPAIIAGDPLPGTPAGWDVTDGQRRADEIFSNPDDGNVSYTYTAAETNPADFQFGAPGGPPRQILPVPAAGHQTVAVLSGAAQVTVSSYGSWLGETDQEDPANAFDGDPATAWAEGIASTPVGQWIQITFDQPMDMPASVGIRLLDDVPDREIASQLRVSTAAGSALTSVAATGATQPLHVAPGRTSWLRITFAAARRVAFAAPGAGISDVLIPGVTVTRLLQPAEDPAGDRAPAVSFSFEQQVPSPVRDASPAAVPAMARTFAVPSPVSLRLNASALALPGTGLDTLLGSFVPGKDVLQVSAASAGIVSAQSLLGGTGGRPWLADSAHPVIQLSWKGKRRISSLVVRPAYGAASTPEIVEISSPDGTRVAPIVFGGVATFSRPLVTNRISLSFPDVQLNTTVSSTGQVGIVPLGLTHLAVPALAGLRPVAPDQNAAFRLACGQGPVLTIDGQPYQTSVSGTIGDLSQFRPVQVRLCTPGGVLPLAAGQHTLIASTPGTFAITSLSLSDAQVPAEQAGARAVTISRWQPDNRRLSVGPGASAYLEIHENYDTGWTASLDGHPLTPVRLDGWQQGFVVPAGPGGTITLTFGPARIYHLGLLASLGGVLLLLIVGAWPVLRRVRRTGSGQEPPARPLLAHGEPAGPAAWWLSVLGVVALVFVTGGLVALAVVVLAGVAYWRPRWLPAVALAAMAASGLLAAVGRLPEGTSALGPFSAPAQATALVALAAALLPAASWADREGRDRRVTFDGAADGSRALHNSVQ
jgi:arabinofuranan 3-O-arabinosyltransferase